MSGNWSFIHEWTIYEYMNHRFEEGKLRIKPVFIDGNLVTSNRWVVVKEMETIRKTDFPDVKSIKLRGGDNTSVAEIKFKTSLFDYHKKAKYAGQYNVFKNNNGFVLVLCHDYLPDDLNDCNIYELDYIDFIQFCRENFIRLLNRQISIHSETKIWLMYQGPNFWNKGNSQVNVAKKSKIWCPTENLNSFDLAKGDTVVFIKTKGKSKQGARDYEVFIRECMIENIIIAKVSSKITSRFEYCSEKKLNHLTTELWPDDPKGPKGQWRWNRVFKFKILQDIGKKYELSSFSENEDSIFLKIIHDVFINNRSREMSHETYKLFLERLLGNCRTPRR
jgi:hypothetical protein